MPQDLPAVAGLTSLHDPRLLPVVVATLAPNLPLLVLFRSLQGLGGGLVMTISLSSIGISIPPALRSKAYVAVSSVWGGFALAGPAIAAVLMAASGIGDPGFTPQSVNLFMAIPVDAEGGLSWEPAVTKPGDSVTMRALMDCVVVVSACLQDVIPINNLDPTRVAIKVRDA